MFENKDRMPKLAGSWKEVTYDWKMLLIFVVYSYMVYLFNVETRYLAILYFPQKESLYPTKFSLKRTVGLWIYIVNRI